MKRVGHRFFLGACFLLLGVAVPFIQPVLAEPTGTNQFSQPIIKELTPGVFQVGSVQLNKEERTITFPATLNMTNGPVEYLLVTSVGKLHESVLRTTVDPMHIHLAALLLGAKGAGTNLTVQQFNTKEIPGEKTALSLSWASASSDKSLRAEECVLNSSTGQRMSQGAWVYNGSQVHGGALVAQRDGLVISIMSDPLALINNPRPGRENDEIWQVNSNSVPPLNSPVKFEIQF